VDVGRHVQDEVRDVPWKDKLTGDQIKPVLLSIRTQLPD